MSNIFDVVDDGSYYVVFGKDTLTLYEQTQEDRLAVITKTCDGFNVKFTSFADDEDKQIAMKLIDVLSKHLIE